MPFCIAAQQAAKISGFKGLNQDKSLTKQPIIEKKFLDKQESFSYEKKMRSKRKRNAVAGKDRDTATLISRSHLRRPASFLSPEKGLLWLGEAFDIAAREEKRNPLPQSLTRLFDNAVKGRYFRDCGSLIFDVLPVQKKAYRAFSKMLTHKDRLALAVLARVCGREAEFHQYITRVPAENGLKVHLKDILLSLRKGQYLDEWEDLAEKAAGIVFDCFEAEDYKKVPEAAQAALAWRFSERVHWHPDHEYRVHRLLVQTLEIPEALKKIHQEKMDILQRRILLTPVHDNFYRFLTDKNFSQLSREARLQIAREHIAILSDLYGVGRPDVRVFSEPPLKDANDVRIYTEMRFQPYYENGVYSYAVEMNEAEAGKGLYESDPFVFIEALSHEFAHNIEALTHHADPKNCSQVKMDNGWTNSMLHMQKSHFLHDPSIAFSFAVNNIEDMSPKGLKKYISVKEGFEQYASQLKERHANSFGMQCAKTVHAAIQVRQILEQPERYRSDVVLMIYNVRSVLGSGHFYEELYDFTMKAKRSLRAAIDRDPATQIRVCNDIVFEIFPLIHRVVVSEGAISDERDEELAGFLKLESDLREKAHLLAKAVEEGNAYARPMSPASIPAYASMA